MKTKKLIPLAIISILFLSVSVLTSCKKDSSMNTDPTTTGSDDVNANAERFQESEGVGSDVDVMTDQAMEMNGIEMRLISSSDDYSILTCATVTRDTINHVVTVDFGAGCTGPHGRTRSGQIIISYSGTDHFTPGFQRTITFNNYYVDQRHIEGTRVITFNGLNLAGNPNWTINAQNMRITRPNGAFHSWNSMRNREMSAGGLTLADRSDDVFSITGNTNGTNSRGDSCTATITNALIKQGSCQFRFVSGTVEIMRTNRPTLILDYGNGTCDDLATITRNGVTTTIHIH